VSSDFGTFDENPRVDQDEWAAEWESLQEDLHEDPYQALGDLADLIDRRLRDQGIAFDDPVVAAGLERELVAELENLHDIAGRTRRGEDVPPGDLGAAIEGARLIWDARKNTIDREDGGPMDPLAAEAMILEADAADEGETRERVD
jgi:hypothetical protein